MALSPVSVTQKATSAKTLPGTQKKKTGQTNFTEAKEQMAAVKEKGLLKYKLILRKERNDLGGVRSWKANAEKKQRFTFLCNKFMKSVELRLPIDQMVNQLDPAIFGYILSSSPFLKVVQFWADACPPSDILKHCQSDPGFKTPTKRDSVYASLVEEQSQQVKEEEIPKVSENPDANCHLFKALKSNLEVSEKLTQIQLISINLSDDSWANLAIGISASYSLKTLQLNQTKISFKGLDLLAEAARLNKSLERIDLSQNDMSDDYGSIVAKFVQSQQEIRDLMKWESSLRGREVDKEISERGLKEFILHHNFFGKQFLKSLGPRIKHDQYLRMLDLKFNSIEKEDLDEFMSCLKQNQTLCSIDMRSTPAFSESLEKRLALIMLKNIEIAYQSKRPLKKTWIVKPLIFIQLPEPQSNFALTHLSSLVKHQKSYHTLQVQSKSPTTGSKLKKTQSTADFHSRSGFNSNLMSPLQIKGSDSKLFLLQSSHSTLSPSDKTINQSSIAQSARKTQGQASGDKKAQIIIDYQPNHFFQDKCEHCVETEERCRQLEQICLQQQSQIKDFISRMQYTKQDSEFLSPTATKVIGKSQHVDKSKIWEEVNGLVGQIGILMEQLDKPDKITQLSTEEGGCQSTDQIFQTSAQKVFISDGGKESNSDKEEPKPITKPKSSSQSAARKAKKGKKVKSNRGAKASHNQSDVQENPTHSILQNSKHEHSESYQRRKELQQLRDHAALD